MTGFVPFVNGIFNNALTDCTAQLGPSLAAIPGGATGSLSYSETSTVRVDGCTLSAHRPRFTPPAWAWVADTGRSSLGGGADSRADAQRRAEDAIERLRRATP